MSDTSEFICQVVKIVGTEPHPNADKLDLVTISLDGTAPFPQKIINSKGGLVAGDDAIYVGPDSVVPLDSPHFEFLKGRLDAKGKTHYRVRSARIRGVYSPGLLIGLLQDHAASPGLGQDVSAALGVTNWSGEPNTPGASSVGSMPKLRAKDIFPVYAVHSLKKCPTFFKEGELVSVTEKIHGTNFRFGYGGRHRFYYGTHRTNLSDPRGVLARLWDWLRRRFIANGNPGFNNPWTEAVEKFKLPEVCKKAKDYVFYGELYGVTANGAAVQKGYTYGADSLQLAVFDVYDARNKCWLKWYQRYDLLWELELPRVKQVSFCLFSFQDIKVFAEQDSFLGGIREGVVVESVADPTRKAKWVSERYHLSKHD